MILSRALWARLAIGLLLGVVVGECAIRVYFAVDPNPPADGFIVDERAGYRMRPEPGFPVGHDDHINAHGFRGREFPEQKPDGHYRVLGIGDSFVYGSVSMPQNFLRVAESLASGRPATIPPSLSSPLEVCLLGAAGYSPANYLGIAESSVSRLDPDLVVLCFFVGNDITGIPVEGEVLGGRLYFRGSASWIHRALRKSSLFLVAERVALSTFKSMFRDPAVDAAQPEGTGPGSDPNALPTPIPDRAIGSDPKNSAVVSPAPTPPYLFFQSRRLVLYQRWPDPELESLWIRAEDYLREFDRVCRTQDVPWFLFLIPTEMQVDTRVQSDVLEKLSRDPEEFDFDAPQRRLRSFAAENGIAVVDPLPRFREAQDLRGRLYFPNDTHWNEAGNQLAGEILAEEIIARRNGP